MLATSSPLTTPRIASTVSPAHEVPTLNNSPSSSTPDV